MGVTDWINQRNVKQYTAPKFAIQAMDAWEAAIRDMKKMLAEEYDNSRFRSEEADRFIAACNTLGMSLWLEVEYAPDVPRPVGYKNPDIHIETIKCILEAYINAVCNDNKYKIYNDRHGKIQHSPAYKRVKKYVLPFLRPKMV